MVDILGMAMEGEERETEIMVMGMEEREGNNVHVRRGERKFGDINIFLLI